MGIYESSVGRDPWKKFRSQRPSIDDVQTYITRLNSAEVDEAVFTGRQGGLAGETGIPNDFLFEVVAAGDGRIHAYVGIDPSSKQPEIEMERCAELGARGFALAPPSEMGHFGGDTWDSTQVRRVLERAQGLSLPVVLTMGPLVGQQHGNPEPVDRIASDYPDLTIICSHGIWPRTSEMIALALRRPNVVLGTSIYLAYPGASQLLSAAAKLIPDQVVYGSAFPFMPLDENQHVISLDISEECRSKFLSGNADRILNPGTEP